ncbi:3-hydroxyisobutyryl-CoA hydrolase 1 [Morella rubra]|uniref:3-hydroxyisobutyryl-CoA hydrolase n=1 Tax=Morella rubra TaxID=262757 RepID=A0A6A1WKR5_9ROSI|nr:3-hydroxyisobutyryl-CoA hydrolase 1 [Morella rubra]
MWIKISRLLELFLANERDPNVKLVIVKGKGRAFCAGGDVAAVVHLVNEGNWRLGAKFFSKEFILNYIMATYRKNQVSILNGIVMGGGAGASIHGRFRVATENSVFVSLSLVQSYLEFYFHLVRKPLGGLTSAFPTCLFAMPETALGLFPDVGASYFLSRLPGFFGEYVGLTGTRLDGAEMLACGLATHFVPSVRLSLLEEALCKLDSTDPALISAIIDEYSHQPSLKEQSAYHRLSVIDRCFSRRTVEEILSALEREVLNKKDDWISATIQSLKAASPMSLKISLRSVREQKA